MRLGQGLPVNMIVLTALALLVLVVVGAFFISGFGQASGSVNVINATQADCQSLCQTLTASAFNYDTCGSYAGGEFGDFLGTNGAKEYACTCDPNFGACSVSLRGGSNCVISQNNYATVAGSAWSTFESSLCSPWTT